MEIFLLNRKRNHDLASLYNILSWTLIEGEQGWAEVKGGGERWERFAWGVWVGDISAATVISMACGF